MKAKGDCYRAAVVLLVVVCVGIVWARRAAATEPDFYRCLGSSGWAEGSCPGECDPIQFQIKKGGVVKAGPTTDNPWTWTWQEAWGTGDFVVECSCNSGTNWSTVATYTVFEVEIDTAFPAFVAKDEDLSLDCTVNGTTGGTFSWTKVTGPGNVTFSPSATSEDPTFSADETGAYTVKVEYTKEGVTCDDTSGNIYVFDVDITTPAAFPAHVAKDKDLSLDCTVTPTEAGGGTFSWTKASGPGDVTFTESDDQDPDFSADTKGDYTVKVEYTKGGSTADDTSSTITVCDVEITAVDIVGVDQTKNMTATYHPEAGVLDTTTWSITAGGAFATLDDTNEESCKITGVAEGTATVKVVYYYSAGSVTCEDTHNVEVTTCAVVSFSVDCSCERRNFLNVAKNGIFEVAFDKDGDQGEVTIKTVPFALTNYCENHPYWSDGLGRDNEIEVDAPALNTVPDVLYDYAPSSAEYTVKDCVNNVNGETITIKSYPSNEKTYTAETYEIVEKSWDTDNYFDTWWSAKLKVKAEASYGFTEYFQEDTTGPGVHFHGGYYISASAYVDLGIKIPIPVSCLPPGILNVCIDVKLDGKVLGELTKNDDNVMTGKIAAELNFALKAYARAGYNIAYVSAGLKATASAKGSLEGRDGDKNDVYIYADTNLGKLTIFVAAGTGGCWILWGAHETVREWEIYDGYNGQYTHKIFPK